MSLERDVVALAGMRRDSAGPGEREAAQYVAGRLRELGVEDVTTQPYRWPRTYAWTHLLHALAALGPRPLSMAAAASYALESSGRLQWLPRLLPKGDGLNVIGRIPARGERRATVVLVAHIDAQRSGFMWAPAIMESGRAQRVRSKAMSPAALPLLAALALRIRTVGLVTAVALLETSRRPVVPGANDNASGVAALLEAARALLADPPDGTEVVLVFPGSEESGMGGFRAFLEQHAPDPATSFVLGLDTVGSGEPVLAHTEGALFGRYADGDLEAVEAGARRAGVAAPERWRVGAWTDPILARHAGLRAASLLSVDPATGMYTRYHRMDDLPEHVDLACVERCAAIAAGTVRELSARAASG